MSQQSAHDSAELLRRAARVKLLVLDCDGVLTDGRITLVADGDEQKSFHVRDGHGLVLWHRAELRSAIISGRRSGIVDRRAAELGVSFVRQGTWNKIADFEEVLREADVGAAEVAVVGDDVTDIPLMRRAELAIAVADAVEETQRAAHYVTSRRGGDGAVREAIEMMLKAQGCWADLMKRYES